MLWQGLRSTASEFTALHFRRGLVGRVHSLYFKANTAHRLLHGPTTSRLDNPDQRITNDIDMLCTLTADLIAKTVITPGVAIYCE